MDEFSNTQSTAPTAPDGPIIDTGWQLPATLSQLVTADCPELLAELIDAFTTDTRSRLQKARSAVAEWDLLSLCRQIHTIKGGALQIGAKTLASMCRDLEVTIPEMSKEQLDEQITRLSAAFQQVCEAMNRFQSQIS
jgi:HPt (histidine-containing phosphotransfer) domain-containing protein